MHKLADRIMKGTAALLPLMSRTERRKREIAKAIEEGVADAHIVLDRDLRYTFLSDEAKALSIFPPERIIGKRFSEVHADFRSNTFYKKYREAIRTKEKVFFEQFSPQLKTWYAVTVYPAAEGGVSVYVRNITEQKRVDDEFAVRTLDLELSKDIIERDKAHDEALLDSIGDGVIATDAEGTVVLLNRQGQRLLGVPESRALGRHFSKVFTVETERGERVVPQACPMGAALGTGKKVANSHYWYSTYPHGRFPAAVTASPIVFNNRTIGAVMVFRNIEREKEVDRTKSEFVSLASHQLRTPLTAIKLLTEMLRGRTLGPLTDTQLGTIKNIERSNEKMIALVNALLNVSRIDSGRLRVKPEPVDLARHITDILAEHRPVARLKQCTLKFSLPANSDLPLVTTDPGLLRQVIANLIANAIQYSPSGRTVTISLRPRTGGYVISVKDAGIGIPKSVQSQVFERFFRAPAAIKKKTDGTGLGLYMSKMMIELLGGKIWFTSKERVGTTFSISVPLSTTMQR